MRIDKKFECALLAELGRILGTEMSVKIIKTVNNGKPYRHLSFSRSDSSKVFGADMDSIYELQKETKDVVKTARAICRQLRRGAFFDVNEETAALLRDWDFVRDKIYLELSNQENEYDILDNVPHNTIFDMVAFVRVNLGEVDEHIKSAIVINSMLDSYGISKDELFDKAIQNTMLQYPAVFQTLSERMKDMINFSDVSEESKASFLDQVNTMEQTRRRECAWRSYVISTGIFRNGARAILYPGVLQKFANSLKTQGFYLTPRSKDECVLVPYEDISSEDKEEFIKNQKVSVVIANATLGNVYDMLSRNMYYYDAEQDGLSIL